ncbi:hypothetical protein G6F62_001676 [Rhizopus arrhizus]|nr:hypothetical protein G6F23_011580 [Rhizopus arrhizus]KAG0756200.1 hypothetical protein G6F24_011312 [Rhizopus arrhizus]KAG0774786.1 hypothetical protein G6F22_013792 [Rhizopus arrhizus]KAG0782197.1 hypothetical protein G6F21_011242 [Rhizopus arrhizus]KAG0807706.1 hypothetical protein G6F20_010161 [Rhizopus arrhizus]
MPYRPLSPSATLESIATVPCPVNHNAAAKSINTSEGAILDATATITKKPSVILNTTKVASQSVASTPMIKSCSIDNDVYNNYFSFCVKCGVDILVFAHERHCPLANL